MKDGELSLLSSKDWMSRWKKSLFLINQKIMVYVPIYVSSIITSHPYSTI